MKNGVFLGFLWLFKIIRFTFHVPYLADLIEGRRVAPPLLIWRPRTRYMEIKMNNFENYRKPKRKDTKIKMKKAFSIEKGVVL